MKGIEYEYRAVNFTTVPRNPVSAQQIVPNDVDLLIGVNITPSTILDYVKGAHCALRLNGKLLLPETMPVELLCVGTDCPPNQRFFEFSEPIPVKSNDTIRFDYIDADLGAPAFATDFVIKYGRTEK